jgi:hypothetical protein
MPAAGSVMHRSSIPDLQEADPLGDGVMRRRAKPSSAKSMLKQGDPPRRAFRDERFSQFRPWLRSELVPFFDGLFHESLDPSDTDRFGTLGVRQRKASPRSLFVGNLW